MITTRRSAYAGLRHPLGHWKPAAIALVAAVLLVTVALPLAILARETGQAGRMAAAVQVSGGAIANSLLLSGAGATLIAALSLLLGYAMGRAPSRLRTMAELAFLVVFAVPSTVVGIGLIDLWNRPGLLGEIYTSPLILVIGYLARFVPVAAPSSPPTCGRLRFRLRKQRQLPEHRGRKPSPGIVLPSCVPGFSQPGS